MAIKIDADTVLINGNIITINIKKPRAEGVAIRDGKFLLVGGNEYVSSAIGKLTKVVDLNGMTAIPGFIDSHSHCLLFGLNALNTIDLTSACSIDEILQLISEETIRREPGTWIVGFGYNHNELLEKRNPTRWDLDKAAPDHPVTLKHCNFHVQTANSMALERAGIKRGTQDPEGGTIVKDKKSGEPLGIFFELPAIRLIENVIPKPSYEQMIEALILADQRFLSEGITSSIDASGVDIIDVPPYLSAYQHLIKNRSLKGRYNLAIWCEKLIDFDNLDEELKGIEWKRLGIGLCSGFGNERLRIGPLKIVADGALSAGTAATYSSYGTPDGTKTCGMMDVNPEKLEKVIGEAHRLGWQLAIHCVGDRAIDSVINAIDKALQTYGSNQSRHRIEHCTLISPESISRLNELGIIAVVQPGFLWELGDSWMRQLGRERAARAKPFRSFLDKNVMMAFSSDRPVINRASAPLIGIHCAVNRKTMTANEFSQNECISPEEALRCYTLNGAFATFEEKIKGSVEENKLADLVVLSEDLTKVPIEKIMDIEVISTMVNGEFVYQRQ